MAARGFAGGAGGGATGIAGASITPLPWTFLSMDSKNSSSPGWSGSPRHCDKSAAWRRLNSSGIFTFSIKAGTRIFLRIASAASVFTQLDATEACDQSTTTHCAESSASSMTWSYSFPAGIVRSHQTDRPRRWSAFESSVARSLSALA